MTVTSMNPTTLTKEASMRTERPSVLLRVSAVLALLALALIVWPIFQPHPMIIMLGMSVGQAIGTLSFAVFGYVVFQDLRRKRVLSTSASHSSMPAPPNPEGE